MESQEEVITSPSTRIKVSTTMKGSEYIKSNMLDNNEETAWYSDQGKFQYIYLFFDNDVSVSSIDVTFCGGFCPKVNKNNFL